MAIMEEELYITKKQVIKIISDDLEPIMTENNFKFVKSKDCFIKKTNFGYLKILININSFQPLKQEINISISVINYEINEIRKLFFGDAIKDDYIISKWLTLPNSNELEYKELYTFQDILIAKQEAFDLIQKEAFIFLEKYSHLESIIEYSKEIKNSYFVSIFLISSKLAKDSRYNEFKKEILITINDKNSKLDQKEALLSLVEYLDNSKV